MKDQSHTIWSQHRPENTFLSFTGDEIEQSIPSRFEKQVDKYPDKIAVKTSSHQLSYRELNQRANSIAHSLLDVLGEKQEPIALLLGHGAVQIATILGILKSGKIYLPLDVHFPDQRLTSVLREAQCTCLITDANNVLLARSLRIDGLTIINLDDPNLNKSLSAINPSLKLSPDAYAYIFYTSGSTGKPKGVVDNHRNVLHNIMRYTNNLHISSEDRLTLLQSASFSGSVSSLFCALLNGATVFPYDIRAQGLGNTIAQWLVREQITMYHSVPVIFRGFLNGNVRFPNVRVIRLEGDAASIQDVELFKKYFESHCLLVNGLGATETGISRQFFIAQHTLLHGGIVPIGYPVEDMNIALLDDNGNELPQNEKGEIAVRSKYLACGYWRNPELTANAFTVAENDPAIRVYRTGDMGRFREDGCLEYLGRKDFQLKILGHRIDPAEVESILLKITGVKDAVVTTTHSPAGNAQLVAYVVSSIHPPPTQSFLRRVLIENLPAYMVPTRFVLMKSLPLNENLKVDRKAIPSPESVARDEGLPFLHPRNEIETFLVEVWESIFKIQPISVNDNFFDLGGDSLFAAQLYAQIQTRYGTDLSMGTIFSFPTIEQLAGVIQSKTSCQSSVIIPLQPFGSKPPLFCVHGHHGHVHAFTALARNIGNDQPLYGLQSVTPIEGIDFLLSIEEMAKRYIHAIKTIQPNGPYSIAGFCYSGIIALEMSKQLQLMGDRVDHLIMFDVTPAEFKRMFRDDVLQRYLQYAKLEKRRNYAIRLQTLTMTERIIVITGTFGRYIRKIISETLLIAHQKFRNVISPALLIKFSDIDIINTHASQRYSPQPFSGKVTVFLSEQTTASYSLDPGNDWSVLGNGGVDVILIQGEGGAMLREPHVHNLSQELCLILKNTTVGMNL